MMVFKYKSVILIFHILEIFVSCYSIEGDAISESNQADRSENVESSLDLLSRWKRQISLESDCVLPLYPLHGKYNASNGKGPGDTVSSTSLSYYCDQGYTLNGSESRQCTMGIWVLGEPTCEVLLSWTDTLTDGGDTQTNRPEYTESSSGVQIASNAAVPENTESSPVIQIGPSIPVSTICTLPPYPLHGKYDAANNAQPGDVVSSTFLTYSCDAGYSLSGSNSHYCIGGTWPSEEPTCRNQCPPLKSISVEFKCYKEGSTLETSCESPQDYNTRAKGKCKDSYRTESPLWNPRCIRGNWDYIPFCTPECGILAPEGNLLLVGGWNATIGQFPWHVGLYDKTNTPITQMCGGSIFYPKLVVTAAHCVYKEGVGLYPASTFAVAAGKLYRRWDAPRDDERYVQKNNVVKIEITDRYRGAINAFTADIAILVLEKSFIFNSFVRPICINFDFSDSLEGRFGKVAGWGLTAEDGQPSPLLQTVTLPYVNYRDCFRNSPESFRPLITSDKICMGYNNGTALCNGDSGGGLVFTRNNGYQDIHYLYGIVSTSPRNQGLTSCSAFAFTAFTDITDRNIKLWFEDIWSTHSILL